MNFNSHAHVERDTGCYGRMCAAGYFNSHAHVERDVTEKTVRSRLKISTHTLTWSVTRTHYLALWSEADFNSHAHVERDINSRMQILLMKISTHTLTWSVTARHGV